MAVFNSAEYAEAVQTAEPFKLGEGTSKKAEVSAVYGHAPAAANANDTIMMGPIPEGAIPVGVFGSQGATLTVMLATDAAGTNLVAARLGVPVHELTAQDYDFWGVRTNANPAATDAYGILFTQV